MVDIARRYYGHNCGWKLSFSGGTHAASRRGAIIEGLLLVSLVKGAGDSTVLADSVESQQEQSAGLGLQS